MPSAGYRVLPPFYDRWQAMYGKDYSSLILPRLLTTIRANRIPRSSMVDVACGTGALALMMARRGWRVYGIDASEGMLRVASAKTKGKGVTVLRQDMRRIRLPEPVTLATSLFDSINHLLSSRDLLRTFRAVHAALRPGGWFAFDVNNERCFRTLWTRSGTMDHPDFTLVLRNSYRPVYRLGEVRLTLFERKSDRYIRHDETVRERWYPDEEVRVLLEKAGFEIVSRDSFGFVADPNIGEVKTWWVARRPGGPTRGA
jgi:SAM-dependent methyltransferase